MWYTSLAVNKNGTLISFFDCKDLYEKAFGLKKTISAALADYKTWRQSHSKTLVGKEMLLNRLMRAQIRADIQNFRKIMKEADELAIAYQYQIDDELQSLAQAS